MSFLTLLFANPVMIQILLQILGLVAMKIFNTKEDRELYIKIVNAFRKKGLINATKQFYAEAQILAGESYWDQVDRDSQASGGAEVDHSKTHCDTDAC